jgi:hypothetical protein
MTGKQQRIRNIRSEISGSSPIAIRGNVVVVLEHEDGTKEYHRTHNIVTTTGNKYYAATAVGSAFPYNGADDFKARGTLRLGTGLATPLVSDNDVGSIIVGGSAPLTAGYPRTLDYDTDNTGSGTNIISWAFAFGTASGNGTITEGAIVRVDTGAIGGAAGTCLTHFLFASSFVKTTSDTLKVFVNHTMLGV